MVGEETCSKCDSTYKLIEANSLCGTWTIECNVCGEGLRRCSGSIDWLSELIKKHKVHLQDQLISTSRTGCEC